MSIIFATISLFRSIPDVSNSISDNLGNLPSSSSASVSSYSSLSMDVFPLAPRTVRCMGPVEGYSLEASDVIAVCKQFSRHMASNKVQAALK